MVNNVCRMLWYEMVSPAQFRVVQHKSISPYLSICQIVMNIHGLFKRWILRRFLNRRSLVRIQSRVICKSGNRRDLQRLRSKKSHPPHPQEPKTGADAKGIKGMRASTKRQHDLVDRNKKAGKSKPFSLQNLCFLPVTALFPYPDCPLSAPLPSAKPKSATRLPSKATVSSIRPQNCRCCVIGFLPGNKPASASTEHTGKA